MYHGRFKGTHYEAGFKWGALLKKNGKTLDSCPTFDLTEKRKSFAKQCLAEYERYYPEVLDEIQGIADGQQIDVSILHTILLSMYCFELENKCTCFAISNDDEIIFARNSDFLVSIEKLYMNCLYKLDGVYRFNGNTTAYVQMEDGVNEHGLAAGLTFVYPHINKPGFNAGMLIRLILEKCKTTDEALSLLSKVPIASAQTITLADKKGNIALIECNPQKTVIIRPNKGESFVATANNFNSLEMSCYINPSDINDWKSVERYNTATNALRNYHEAYTVDFAKNLLAGKYGFMCQYDRKLNADTVWSVVYDLKRNQIWRVEGNPFREQFKEDKRI